MEQNAVVVSEELQTKYRPRTESYIRLSHIAPGENEKLRTLFDELKNAKKQLRLLMGYLELSGFMQRGSTREVSRKELLERTEVSPPDTRCAHGQRHLRDLCQRVEPPLVRPDCTLSPPTRSRPYSRRPTMPSSKGLPPKTTIPPARCYVERKDRNLYPPHRCRAETGTTSSLPRARNCTRPPSSPPGCNGVFGNKLAIYHSKFTDNERVEIWNNLLHDSGLQIVLGVRLLGVPALSRPGSSSLSTKNTKAATSSRSPATPLSRPQRRHRTGFDARSQNVAGLGHTGHRELFQRPQRQIRTGRTSHPTRGDRPATHSPHRHGRPAPQTPGALRQQPLSATERGLRRGPQQRRAGDTVPEPPGLCSHGGVPPMRLDSPLHPLRREPHPTTS